MTYEEVKYELKQMTNEEISQWFFRNYGEDLEKYYSNLSRKELIHEVAYDNAQ